MSSYTVKVEIKPSENIKPLRTGSGTVIVSEYGMRMIQIAAIKKAANASINSDLENSVAKGLNDYERQHPPIIKDDPVKRGVNTAQWTAVIKRDRVGQTSYRPIYNVKLVNKQKPYPYVISVSNSNGTKVYKGEVANLAAVRLAESPIKHIVPYKMMNVYLTELGNTFIRRKPHYLRYFSRGKARYVLGATYHRANDEYRKDITDTVKDSIHRYIMREFK